MVISCGYRRPVLFVSPSIFRPSRAPLIRNHVSQTISVELFTLFVRFCGGNDLEQLIVIRESVQRFFNVRSKEFRKSVGVAWFKEQILRIEQQQLDSEFCGMEVDRAENHVRVKSHLSMAKYWPVFDKLISAQEHMRPWTQITEKLKNAINWHSKH